MSCFKVWVRTDRLERIPERKRIYIEEPRRRRGGVWDRAARTASLWYNIRIYKLAQPVIDEDDDPELPSLLSPRPPPSDDEDGTPDGREEGQDPVARGGATPPGSDSPADQRPGSPARTPNFQNSEVPRADALVSGVAAVMGGTGVLAAAGQSGDDRPLADRQVESAEVDQVLSLESGVGRSEPARVRARRPPALQGPRELGPRQLPRWAPQLRLPSRGGV